MEHVRWTARPDLHRPVMLAAFAGWNDAGDASTTAVRYLSEQWDSEQVAEIDAEEFFDFTETRPCVELVNGISRRITWPTTTISVATPQARTAEPARDVVLVLGTEPQLRWRTFCRQVADVAFALQVEQIVILGALLAEVPHTRPVPITGSASDPALVLRHGLRRSRYEGPTGIVGVLHQACDDAGLASISLWATVPSYVPGTPSPRAALALVERVSEVLEADVDTTLLEVGARRYQNELDELVAADEESADYVRRLEGNCDERSTNRESEPAFTDDDAHRVADEVERFLRERPPGSPGHS